MGPIPFETSTVQVDGQVAVVSVSGELDLGTAGEFERSVAGSDGARGSLLVDLSGCEFIDSTGIALLVRTWQELGERFALSGCNAQVRRVLEVTGLTGSIPLYESRAEALDALRS